MEGHNDTEELRIGAVCRTENTGWKVNAQQQELCELNLSDVFFPPNGFFHIFIECTEQIVSVHDRVYKAVQYAQHCSMTSSTESCCNVSTDNHASVMINVQEGDVAELFTSDEEELSKEEKSLMS